MSTLTFTALKNGSTISDSGLIKLGYYIGAKTIPINSGWFKPQRFTSIFTKPYGQRIIAQNLIGGWIALTIQQIKNRFKEGDAFPITVPAHLLKKLNW